MSDWTPAFPGQRPPFKPGNDWRAEPGNQLAVKHGAFAPSRVDPLARRIAKELRATDGLDYLSAPRFAARLSAYSQAQAKAELLAAWVDTLLVQDQTTAPRGGVPPLELLRQLETRASNLSEHLGLTPAGADLVANDIVAARRTLARRAERKSLQADLRASLREQLERNDNP